MSDVDAVDAVLGVLLRSKTQSYDAQARHVVDAIRADPVLRAALLGVPEDLQQARADGTLVEEVTIPDPAAQQERRARWRQAVGIDMVDWRDGDRILLDVLEVADAEMADLKAEVEMAGEFVQANEEMGEALTKARADLKVAYAAALNIDADRRDVLAETTRLADLLAATNARCDELRAEVERLRAAREVQDAVIERATGETKRLKAALGEACDGLARVRALAEEWSLNPEARAKAMWDRTVAILLGVDSHDPPKRATEAT
jgi:hypothetical protein